MPEDFKDPQEDFMQVQPFRYIYNSDRFTFAKCGLDISRNFMHQREGMDGIYFEDESQMYRFCFLILEDVPSLRCGIFLLRLNGEIDVVIQDKEETNKDGYVYQLTPCVGKDRNYSAVLEVALDEELLHYAVLSEVSHLHFIVIES